MHQHNFRESYDELTLSGNKKISKVLKPNLTLTAPIRRASIGIKKNNST
jgi:hypothetical protein